MLNIHVKLTPVSLAQISKSTEDYSSQRNHSSAQCCCMCSPSHSDSLCNTGSSVSKQILIVILRQIKKNGGKAQKFTSCNSTFFLVHPQNQNNLVKCSAGSRPEAPCYDLWCFAFDSNFSSAAETLLLCFSTKLSELNVFCMYQLAFHLNLHKLFFLLLLRAFEKLHQ